MIDINVAVSLVDVLVSIILCLNHKVLKCTLIKAVLVVSNYGCFVEVDQLKACFNELFWVVELFNIIEFTHNSWILWSQIVHPRLTTDCDLEVICELFQVHHFDFDLIEPSCFDESSELTSIDLAVFGEPFLFALKCQERA